MTQSDFNTWPLNLSPWHVKQVLGVDDEGLRTLREQHPEIVVRQCGRGKRFYSKSAIAKLAALVYE